MAYQWYFVATKRNLVGDRNIQQLLFILQQLDWSFKRVGGPIATSTPQMIVSLYLSRVISRGNTCAYRLTNGASSGASMDEFSQIVLEDTLQLATEGLPSELISDCVSGIRECVNAMAVDPSDRLSARKLRHALDELSDIAHRNNEFLVETRLHGIARQFDVPGIA
jgi:hypothetical protein